MKITVQSPIRTGNIALVVFYNLALLAGASYLIVAHDLSAWLYLLALLFAASWNTEKEKINE
jgi:hypothetical protein